MNPRNHSHFFSKMVVRLWLLMMALVMAAIAIMWIIQVYILERNYTGMVISEIQNRLEPIVEELPETDLADREDLLPYLSKTIDGKVMLINEDGRLIALYSYGLAMEIGEDGEGVSVWKDIENSHIYQLVLDGEPFTRQTEKGSRISSYEMGFPVQYDGESAYIILYRSFSELYQVLDMNRRQLIVLTILLTLVASVLAAVLSRKFVRPIHVIRDTVNKLTMGDLGAVPEVKSRDEMGQLADSVKELGQALQRVDALRRELIANVSHELRSPLSLIGGYAEMVRDIHWKDREKREEDLDLIIRESRRMSEMVSDILDYSQLQAGYLKLRKDWYNLNDIVESEVMLCEQSASEYHIKIQYLYKEAEHMIYADALKISQVVRNLLNNAINHTKDGAPIIVEITEQPGTCKVAVKNEGDPIPEEERELIWERYHRSQHQGGRSEGTGLGLSIVSTILKAHGMTYGVDYQNGMTVFWFQCERKKMPRERAGKKRMQNTAGSGRACEKKNSRPENNQ